MTIRSDDGIPPDSPGSGSAIRGVLAVGSAVALSLFGDMGMYVILPVHYVELGLTALQVGVLLSANRWVRLVTNHLAERLLRRLSSRILFPAALLTGSLITGAYSIAELSAVPTFATLLVLRLVWGLCWSFIRHTGVMTTMGIAGPSRVGRLMGVYAGLVQAGFVAGTFAAGVLFDGVGFSRTFLLAAVMSLAAVPVAVAGGRRSSVTLKDGLQDGAIPPDRASLLLSIRGFIVSLVGAGLIMSTLGYMLRNRYGETVPVGSLVLGVTTVNGALLAAQYLVNSAGSPFLGIAIDRHGIRRAQVLGFAASGAALFALGVLGSGALFVPLVVVFFISAAISRLAVESQAALAGQRAYSGLASATDLGSAVGPVLGWIGIELSRSGITFWAGGGLFAVGAALALLTPRARRRA